MQNRAGIGQRPSRTSRPSNDRPSGHRRPNAMTRKRPIAAGSIIRSRADRAVRYSSIAVAGILSELVKEVTRAETGKELGLGRRAEVREVGVSGGQFDGCDIDVSRQVLAADMAVGIVVDGVTQVGAERPVPAAVPVVELLRRVTVVDERGGVRVPARRSPQRRRCRHRGRSRRAAHPRGRRLPKPIARRGPATRARLRCRRSVHRTSRRGSRAGGRIA